MDLRQQEQFGNELLEFCHIQRFHQRSDETGEVTPGAMIYHMPLPGRMLLCDVFVSGDRELAPGNLNHLPAGAEQLTRTVSAEVELTLARSSPCWWRPRYSGLAQCRRASRETLLSHVFVWVQFLIRSVGGLITIGAESD